MDARTVVELLDRLRGAGIGVWIGGGWGIDALLGRQTRPHRDLDLMHELEYEHLLVSVLRENGYAETLDARPVRFVMTHASGLELDLHPLVFAADGSARQAADDRGATFDYPRDCFVTGRVLRAAVPCLSAAQQVYFHQGYEPRRHDLHDMARLREAFNVSTHF